MSVWVETMRHYYSEKCGFLVVDTSYLYIVLVEEIFLIKLLFFKIIIVKELIIYELYFKQLISLVLQVYLHFPWPWGHFVCYRMLRSYCCRNCKQLLPLFSILLLNLYKYIWISFYVHFKYVYAYGDLIFVVPLM